jgi:hypothetical protein
MDLYTDIKRMKNDIEICTRYHIPNINKPNSVSQLVVQREPRRFDPTTWNWSAMADLGAVKMAPAVDK